MKNHLTPVSCSSLKDGLRTAALAATLLLAPALAFAGHGALAESAARQLAITGALPVTAVGPYVEIGTYQIQVSTKLGRPSARLADSTWFYHDFVVEDTAARGTLVVRFRQGRVSELALVTPATATAMLHAPKQTGDRILVAQQP